MTDRTPWHVRVRTRTPLLVLAATLLASLATVPLPSRAGPCDQVGGVITGDWTITNVQVCSGIFYTVDGSVTISAGGSLTLVDGGIQFAKDAAHSSYALAVNAGGVLELDNSVVTVVTDAISPSLKLAFTVSGANSRLTMRNGAVLKFPGWFNATGATLEIWDSTITGFTSADLAGLGVYPDDHDDGPVVDWASTTAALYRSRIERMYENASAASDPNATGVIAGNLALRSSSALYAYDSHIGVDFSNVRGLHNELQVDATSNAYLFGVTIDRTQDPLSRTDWRPAYRPLAVGGSVYLMRWLHLTAVDSTAFPVSGATITATLSPSQVAAQYPDNSFGAVPSAFTLDYLGRGATGTNAWDVTDATGTAVIPLYTDQITTATLPNGESFGNYRLDIAFQTTTTVGGVDFDPYPAIAWTENNAYATVPFSGLTVRTGPDLLLRQDDYSARTVFQGQSFDIYATIYNQGQTSASGVSLAAYLDGDRGTEVARVDGLTVDATLNQTLVVSGVGVVGAHSLMIVVDPDNAINEGGTAQELNNFANLTIAVQPPPSGYIAILSPEVDQAVEPGATLGVTGYVRDENATGLVGVPLTIELRSGTTTVATGTATTGALGYFSGSVTVPESLSEGSYRVVVSPSAGSITPDSRAVAVRRAVSLLETPILGIPLWLILIVIIGAAAVAGGGTAYAKYVGLGKVVECGECGAFIARDSARCPKCGVEFEKDMAKCSNCGTWIPVALKQCPECGVEFTTGEVAIKDYEAQMRTQYEQVKRKFKEMASRELGRSLTDFEFESWWRSQPTFMTFEDWLRDEEDMRRMGSKPCPWCQSLNSVTATVCHKCGTPMAGEQKRARPAARPTAPPSSGGEPAPTTPVAPKRPPEAGPVVQKKVIRASEGPGGTGTEVGDTESDEQI